MEDFYRQVSPGPGIRQRRKRPETWRDPRFAETDPVASRESAFNDEDWAGEFNRSGFLYRGIRFVCRVI